MKFSTIMTAAGLLAAVECKKVHMCKRTGKQDCVPVDSAWTCDNLVSGDGRPFVSGRVLSRGSCDIFSENGCSGISNTMDTAGWNKFPFNVKSIRC
ncbi:hypothetical protein HIM_12597 [Hirsutella minnesotensis 3608]|uniref:Uncharacterized protein n=1 Tax=Hirsutella minnesotensis 3608 TaxID=1043627 RepID=A0A0F7ZQK3_9HYPO|nr:hypothetical protein HIM_12597 [Hirsutella minnesotensis 3608]